jgi:hypothetical protein
VLDAKRIGKRGMKSMMMEEDLPTMIHKYALYSVDLN